MHGKFLNFAASKGIKNNPDDSLQRQLLMSPQTGESSLKCLIFKTVKRMNKHDVEMRVNLRANTNSKSEQYGHLYPYLDRLSTLDTRGVCDFLLTKNTVYGRDVIEGVLTLFSQCVPDMLSFGVAIQLTGLGTFYPSLTSTPFGAASLDAARQMGVDQIVKGVHVRFLPDSTKLDNITSKKFKERCNLSYHMLETVTKVTTAGKTVYYHSYTPINQDPPNEPTP